MPNHVTSVCQIYGPKEDVQAFRSLMFVETDKGLSFDFGQVIPMPASVAATSGRGGLPDVLMLLLKAPGCHTIWERFREGPQGEHFCHWKGTAIFQDGEIERCLESAYPGIVADARQMALAYGETGYPSWYEWSIANWGTKWNSYSFLIRSDDPLRFEFDTAWDFPTPVFEALTQRFPSLTFECFAFDEGWNFAAGGLFNHDKEHQNFRKTKATDELYEIVYGHKPETGEEPGVPGSDANPDGADPYQPTVTK